jgi:hypothetical protein
MQYDVDVYLGKIKTSVTANMTVPHATVRHLTRMVKGHKCNIYMDNPGYGLRKKNYFSLLRHDNSNNFLLLTACGDKMTERDFLFSLTQNFIGRTGSPPCQC